MRGRNPSAASGAYFGDRGGIYFIPTLYEVYYLYNIHLRFRLQSDKSKRPWVTESQFTHTKQRRAVFFLCTFKTIQYINKHGATDFMLTINFPENIFSIPNVKLTNW